LSVAAAEWLLERQIKLVAVDMPTPELPLHLRSPGVDWPVHHTLPRDGVLIAEQVTNARSLAGAARRFPLSVAQHRRQRRRPPRVSSGAPSTTEPQGVRSSA
jgi:kynurenine formamidase